MEGVLLPKSTVTYVPVEPYLKVLFSDIILFYSSAVLPLQSALTNLLLFKYRAIRLTIGTMGNKGKRGIFLRKGMRAIFSIAAIGTIFGQLLQSMYKTTRVTAGTTRSVKEANKGDSQKSQPSGMYVAYPSKAMNICATWLMRHMRPNRKKRRFKIVANTLKAIFETVQIVAIVTIFLLFNYTIVL